MTEEELEELEINLLLTAIKQRYGYDFSHYARPTLNRRIRHRLQTNKLSHISEMLPLIVHDELFFDNVLKDMSITVTEMFRDPHFYIRVREKIIPLLKTYPFIKIWHAGCASGEEVYSMAILLREEGCLEQVQIYATDCNKRSLAVAEEGIYPAERIKLFTDNYYKAGGERSFSDYYHACYGSAKLDESLRKNIIFAHHNLVTDGVFGEMNLIICRNVMIYFDRTLKSRVLQLFLDSLCDNGLLCLGSKEGVDDTNIAGQFEVISKTEKIYKKGLLPAVSGL